MTFLAKTNSVITLDDLPGPEPVPDMATYLKEREISLEFSERRRINYQRYLGSKIRKEKIDYLPIRLDFENVSRCNFRCTMCQVSSWEKGRRALDMSLDDFKKIIDSQYGLVEIKIQGMGEPTLQGDDFFEMIRYARSKKIWVRTITNASLLHLKNNYRKLIDSGVNEIQISIDGADRETFEQIRVGSKYDQVVANCKLINDYGQQNGLAITKMWTVVQKRNIHQLEDLVIQGVGMGFKNIVFSLELVDWGQEKWHVKNKKVSVTNRIEVNHAKDLINLGESLGVKVRWWNQTKKYQTNKQENLCPWPFERGYISSDLRIVPCCVLGNPDVSDIGDATYFDKEWNGKKMIAFRNAHITGEIPKFCEQCYE